MELKFKTIYKNELVSCEISTFENLIFIETGNFYTAVGRITDKYKLDNGFKILPIYRYTGLKDSLGNEIYEGHIIKITILEIPMFVTMVWNKEDAGFFLKKDGELHKLNNLRDGLKIETAGHIGLKLNGSCGGVA